MTRSIDPTRRSLPLDEWPAPDRIAWARACRPGDPFDPSIGRALRWKASTREKVIQPAYGHWLNHLSLIGELDPALALGERLTRERVHGFIDAMERSGLADYTRALRLRSLGQALEVMDPEFDASWIKRGGDRIHCRAEPVRQIEARLRSPVDVVQLAEDMMAAAETDRFRTPVEKAVLYRDGLIIAFLVHRPWRRENVAAMQLGQHLVCRDGVWKLHVDGSETKTGRPIDAAWPEALTSALERYLDVHRPALLGGDAGDHESALWIGKGGRPMGPDAISFQVTSRTRQEFGTAINPHTFRHMAATTIAEEDPASIEDAATLLGHSSLDLTEAHYIRAQMSKASTRYQELIERQRRWARRRRRDEDQGNLF
jgi:integrase